MGNVFGLRVGPKGRIVIPAALRHELGIDEGADVVVRAEHGRLVVESRAFVLEGLRAVVGDAVPAEVSLVDELLAARKDEAGHERERRRRR